MVSLQSMLSLLHIKWDEAANHRKFTLIISHSCQSPLTMRTKKLAQKPRSALEKYEEWLYEKYKIESGESS